LHEWSSPYNRRRPRLGAATSRAVAAAGYTVVIHANRSADDATSLAEELGGHVVLGDLADPKTPERLISEAVAKAGPLFALINNASRFEYDGAGSVTAESIAAHAAPNLIAPVLLTRYFASQPELGRRVVINMLDRNSPI